MERSSHRWSRNTYSRFLSPKHAVVCRHVSIYVLFVAIVHLSPINAANYRHSSLNRDVCQTFECFRSEAVFKQNMDLSVDPCDDFYSYACGHWATSNPTLNRWQTHDWSAVQRNKIDRMIQDHLEAYISRSDPKPVVQAKTMYKACIKSLAEWEDSEFGRAQARYRFGVIYKYLKKFGLPTTPTLSHSVHPVSSKESKQDRKFDWISSVAKIQRHLGFNVMIGLFYAGDKRNMDRFRVTLGYFGESLLVEYPWYVTLQPKGNTSKTQNEKSQKLDGEANTNDDQQNVDSYPEELEVVYANLDVLLKEERYMPYRNKFEPLTEQFKAFQNQLKVLETEWKEEEPTYYTVAELQNITDSHIAPREPYPVWQHYLDVLFADLPDNKHTADEKLLISPQNLKYLCNLVDFISKQSPEHIELYIWTTVVKFLYDHRFNNARREEDCTEYVQKMMEFTVAHTITDKNFLNETKPRVEQLFSNIRSEFNQMVLETEWIDGQTKNALVEKSKAVETQIGYPEWILDADKLEEHYRGLKVDRFRHFENWLNARQIIVTKKLQLLHVNLRNIRYISKYGKAYNSKILNLIHISGGTLQYPFYYLGLEAMNYGALGSTLGHELTHNFDNLDRLHDKFGGYEQVWSNHSLQKFEERVSCLVEQYDSYYVPEVEGYINGTLTHKENIADNGGIQEAFRAYREYVKRNGPEPLLPGFEDFSHDQLFFISYGNQFCETLSSSDKEKLLKGSHSPGKYRVLGVLSNMEEFSEAFQCPPGSKMNPEKKCRVW